MERRHGMIRVAMLALLGVLTLSATGCYAGYAGVRVYDPGYGDYHYWNSGEEAQFRVYLNERREPYRDYRGLSRDDQRDYWKWRHEHDHDRDRDRDQDRR